jgi:hypothetical protein
MHFSNLSKSFSVILSAAGRSGAEFGEAKNLFNIVKDPSLRSLSLRSGELRSG